MHCYQVFLPLHFTAVSVRQKASTMPNDVPGISRYVICHYRHASITRNSAPAVIAAIGVVAPAEATNQQGTAIPSEAEPYVNTCFPFYHRAFHFQYLAMYRMCYPTDIIGKDSGNRLQFGCHKSQQPSPAVDG